MSNAQVSIDISYDLIGRILARYIANQLNRAPEPYQFQIIVPAAGDLYARITIDGERVHEVEWEGSVLFDVDGSVTFQRVEAAQ